jgi:hypothetical protein
VALPLILGENPAGLPVPKGMDAAIRAKCRAQDELIRLNAIARQTRQLRAAWKKRLAVCLKRMTDLHLAANQ